MSADVVEFPKKPDPVVTPYKITIEGHDQTIVVSDNLTGIELEIARKVLLLGLLTVTP